jgi:hypothetical protein
MIERKVAGWSDLVVGFGLEPLEVPPSGAVGPGTRPG